MILFVEKSTKRTSVRRNEDAMKFKSRYQKIIPSLFLIFRPTQLKIVLKRSATR